MEIWPLPALVTGKNGVSPSKQNKTATLVTLIYGLPGRPRVTQPCLVPARSGGGGSSAGVRPAWGGERHPMVGERLGKGGGDDMAPAPRWARLERKAKEK